jgi:hypothetical protein
MRRAYLPTLLILLALTVSTRARTWYITPDGLGDAPTIQAGIDSAAAGDTVLVACGTYYEWGIHDLGPGVVLVSETGESGCATIDAQQEWSVFTCWGCDSTTIIKGFTITGGQTSEDEGPPGAGGGMKCACSVRVVNCLFVDNLTYGYGGAVWVDAGSPRFENCVFADNTADQGGAIFINSMASCIITNCTFVGNYSGTSGTVYCIWSSPRIEGCTFYGNAAGDRGSGIACFESGAPEISNTIIAAGSSGRAVDCDEWSHPAFSCCDIYGNAGGDWEGYIAAQLGADGNFSADPLFCDTAVVDFTLQECSPCLPGNHPDGYDCGGVIGAFGEGCACGASTVPSTWGTIKAMYR